jgi:hypothetical protein
MVDTYFQQQRRKAAEPEPRAWSVVKAAIDAARGARECADVESEAGGVSQTLVSMQNNGEDVSGMFSGMSPQQISEKAEVMIYAAREKTERMEAEILFGNGSKIAVGKPSEIRGYEPTLVDTLWEDMQAGLGDEL